MDAMENWGFWSRSVLNAKRVNYCSSALCKAVCYTEILGHTN